MKRFWNWLLIKLHIRQQQSLLDGLVYWHDGERVVVDRTMRAMEFDGEKDYVDLGPLELDKWQHVCVSQWRRRADES